MEESLRGLRVRLYDEDEYFWDGHVTWWDSNFADVDYGDWIQRYPVDQLIPIWTTDGTYENVLIPNVPGTVVADYRDPA